MTKTIELTKVRIKSLIIDPVSKIIYFDYSITTENDIPYQHGRASAFVDWPKDKNGNPMPERSDWFQLTQNEISAATQLINTAIIAMTTRLNNGEL
jgi:hypothetical protein